ncbi:MAG: discoidin domain-containing protein [Clostridia bacterium]|nr:discoidin domain-containing protein [Clostridia bacterium]
MYSSNGVISYPDENGVTLTDGHDAIEAKYSDAAWAGFNRGTQFCQENGYANIIVDLGAKYDLERFVVKAASKQLSNGIEAPASIEVYVSSDNETWSLAGKADYTDDETLISVSAVVNLEEAVTARYIEYRVIFQDAETKINWAFISEVEAYGVEATEDEPEQPEQPTYMLGDVNDDKKVDSVDYLLVKRACFKTYELNEGEFIRADVSLDEIIDSTDYLLVKRIAFGTYTVE